MNYTKQIQKFWTTVDNSILVIFELAVMDSNRDKMK